MNSSNTKENLLKIRRIVNKGYAKRLCGHLCCMDTLIKESHPYPYSLLGLLSEKLDGYLLDTSIMYPKIYNISILSISKTFKNVPKPRSFKY